MVADRLLQTARTDEIINEVQGVAEMEHRMPDEHYQEVAIVTGAAAGIGRAAARRLAADGYRVACLDIDEGEAGETAAQIQKDGGTAIAASLDVGSDSSVRQAFEQVQAELGTPDVLVSCAGILHISPALELRADDWRKTVDVNLTGTFLAPSVAR